ncbi:NADPH-dependent FMN reductase [Chryseolinea sp. H1M3-3]|uniref:NADPH-dependent FMN reductase n=1 Tax=Chryseolinea sp. H1M3-3 TaxID=3034144 RepID=UPI0023EC229D|nr:NADPH-dependent FMN reductase [Chryseolinea sp. H1M3-3]
MAKKKILGIPGSVRTQSINQAILQNIADLYADKLDLKICSDLSQLPHFNPDLGDDNLAESVAKFRQEVSDADGVIICTPEYVFSPPAILKNALEWTVSTTVFSEKPVALIVASGLGEKTYESLTLILHTLGARLPPSSKLLIQGARAKFKAAGDQQTIEELKRTMASFIQSIENLH